LQSLYKEDYEKYKDKNKYAITETEKYKTMKDGEKILSDVSDMRNKSYNFCSQI